MWAVTTLLMNSRIVEENSIVARFEREAGHRALVGPPIGIVHAGRGVIAAVPGCERLAVPVLLAPFGWARLELPAKFVGPVLVKRVEFDHRRGAQVTDRKLDAGCFRAAIVFAHVVA